MSFSTQIHRRLLAESLRLRYSDIYCLFEKTEISAEQIQFKKGKEKNDVCTKVRSAG